MERALILAPFNKFQIGKLSQTLEVIYESWLRTKIFQDPEQLGNRLRSENISILVIESDFVFEETFDLAPNLKFVGICRSATNQIDVGAASEHGIAVVNTPGRNAQAVAEHTVGLMFALARKIPQLDRYVKDQRWQSPVDPYIDMRGVELSGRTLGIIGLGSVGGRLAQIALALNINVIAYDPLITRSCHKIKLVDLHELMALSDFVSVSVPSIPATEGMLGVNEIGLMKTTAYLINTTETSVIQQNAIVNALQNNKIAGAAFDVFGTHPVSPENPLLKLDNVILTPHIGGATEETIARHSQMMADDILRFLRGDRPINLVNSEVWEKRA